ncbi:MAG: hypothetical protein RDV48_06985 [Candidatus Eremiobacteraeota bacterium]|nr:hypothetical protein [Candidatus Eremiobacteraeota bacterium]
MDELYAYWQLPRRLPDEDSTILSFLSPKKEIELQKKFRGNIINARDIAIKVKDEAIRAYLELIAGLGATPIKERGNITLRQALRGTNGYSKWWFHKVSHRDCESDKTFNHIIEIAILQSVIKAKNYKKVFLYECSEQVFKVLRSRFPVDGIRIYRQHGIAYIFLRGLLSRVKEFFLFLYYKHRTRKIHCNEKILDVVFSGFLDWSVREKKGGGIEDRFFRSLPEVLLAKGLRTGWFIWLDPRVEPVIRGKKLEPLIEFLNNNDKVILLQNFLSLIDCLRALTDFSSLFCYLKYCQDLSFRELFIYNGLDYYPLLREPLYYGFINGTLPRLEMVFLAASRAFKKYAPKITMSFLELYPYSRAFYLGAQSSAVPVLNYAMQHASYSREKVFGIIDPEREYHGSPDDCPIPSPHGVFVMGDLGKEVFISNGFPEERVFLTGSSRYENIKTTPFENKTGENESIRLLIVASLDRDADIELLEAVCLATSNIDMIKVHLRNHPFAHLDQHPQFVEFRKRISITDDNLEEDVKKADLILFSNSSVAEEALIRGKPVWQWRSKTYNSSVFRDIGGIPFFTSVAALEKAIKEFQISPEQYSPSKELRAEVLRKCFYLGDGKESERISQVIIERIGRQSA